MPKGLIRYQKAGGFHFFIFSCYQRKPLLNTNPAYETFEQELETIRKRYNFVNAGYILMPGTPTFFSANRNSGSAATTISTSIPQTCCE